MIEQIGLPSNSGNGENHGFYLPKEAHRIARVPQWTLNSWRRQGVIVPSVEWIDEDSKSHLGHTFETVVFLRLLKMIRDEGITLIKAVEAVKSLRDRFGPPGKAWTNARIFVEHKDVYVYARDVWGTTVSTRHEQKLADPIFGKEFALLKDRADALLIPSEFQMYVEIDPVIRNGLPIVLNTSVQTSIIHSLRQQDYKYEDIHDMYPIISCESIIGANAYENFLDKVSATG